MKAVYCLLFLTAGIHAQQLSSIDDVTTASSTTCLEGDVECGTFSTAMEPAAVTCSSDDVECTPSLETSVPESSGLSTEDPTIAPSNATSLTNTVAYSTLTVTVTQSQSDCLTDPSISISDQGSVESSKPTISTSDSTETDTSIENTDMETTLPTLIFPISDLMPTSTTLESFSIETSTNAEWITNTWVTLTLSSSPDTETADVDITSTETQDTIPTVTATVGVSDNSTIAEVITFSSSETSSQTQATVEKRQDDELNTTPAATATTTTAAESSLAMPEPSTTVVPVLVTAPGAGIILFGIPEQEMVVFDLASTSNSSVPRFFLPCLPSDIMCLVGPILVDFDGQDGFTGGIVSTSLVSSVSIGIGIGGDDQQTTSDEAVTTECSGAPVEESMVMVETTEAVGSIELPSVSSTTLVTSVVTSDVNIDLPVATATAIEIGKKRMARSVARRVVM